ncbi:hypothetical protein M427DRAFT_30452 [Gonapodya prolifera JEL478]|uniref:HAT C-terminal dimerisation domain-containing protein n=1 Tax=Gonapodya prolifera (strain JEL478) TaxID=1344416 RepID=A0A139AKI3_GONPJ|nr:hypothetical protein M427DRAFT_30452 [Gonapodya prolifera JEL478]|eukprot:KXS17301.1 hypothetical protein M427DRAFT_30452 [Gonapodya prolifera JEL478]
MSEAPSPTINVSDSELSDTINADGWRDCKPRVSTHRPASWVFRDDHFKKQAKGKQTRAICLEKGKNGCNGAIYDMTNQKSTTTLQIHVKQYYANSIKDERVLAELKPEMIRQPTLEDTLKLKRKRNKSVDVDRLQAALLNWVACSNQPISKVESPWFWQVLAVLHHNPPEIGIEMIRFDIPQEMARVEGVISELLKLLSVTTNNGSNNNTMMRAMADMDGINEDFDAINSHVQCLSHILNIAVKAGLANLRIPTINEERMVEAMGQGPVEKLYHIIFRIRHTTQLCKKYAAQFTNPLKHSQELVAPVKTRWRSDYDTIIQALADCIEINKLVTKEKALWKWKLTDVDWEYLKHMKVLLMKVEAAKIPTLCMVVPVFNLVMDRPEDADFGREQCLEDTRSIILSKLQTYYRKTDDSRLYMLSVVLHPLLKLGWMAEENWEQELIGRARELLQGELDRVAPSSALVTPQGNPAFLDDDLEMEFLGKGNTQGEMEQYR